MLLQRHKTDRYDLEEFYNQVASRSDTGYPQAAIRARAVTAVLQEAVSAEKIDDILSQLPKEYEELFNEVP